MIGDDVFMSAVDFGHVGMAAWLLDQGANVNAVSRSGSRNSALHSAAWNGDLPMVRLLLERGADPEARDAEHDNTPLGWAQVSRTVTNNPDCEAVAALLETALHRFASGAETRAAVQRSLIPGLVVGRGWLSALAGKSATVVPGCRCKLASSQGCAPAFDQLQLSP